MSDLMLLGALRAPTPEPDNVLAIAQLADRARQAADEIERLREALEQIATHETVHLAYVQVEEMKTIAREALKDE